MRDILANNELVLMEASIVECLRRDEAITLHPRLMHTPLIYETQGRNALTALFQGYIDIAIGAKLPFLMLTPTWRANHDRVTEAGIRNSINRDAVKFLSDLRETQGCWTENIKIGGLVGCRNDCYKPEEGLSAEQAERFHAWQIGELALGAVDFLIAETLPSVEEALGIARAMQSTGLPYIISFVISRNGRVLDGTDLQAAIGIIDAGTSDNPVGFMVNCAYPSFLCPATQPPGVFDRLIGYQANASSLDHCDLDGAGELHRESTSQWGDLMLELNRVYGVKILGGCCGTGAAHLHYISREK